MKGLRALVIDDNSTSRTILQSQLSKLGIQTEWADDGTRGLERLREDAARGRPYDFALLDLTLPGKSGLEIARLAKSDEAIGAIRIVLLSPYGRRSQISLAQSKWFDASVSKPIREESLASCLAGLVDLPPSRPSDAVPASPAPAQPAPISPAATGSADPGLRVLIVEDNEVNQRVTGRILGKLGYQTDVAATGHEAVEALSRRGPYAAVIMDWQMPDMDGFKATAEIRRLERARLRTPIIAMTASAMAGDRERALESGMDDYIAKPVRIGELKQALGRLLAARQLPSEPPLDEAALDDLVGLENDGEAEFLPRLLELFVEDSRRILDRLARALDEKDARELERAAHTLKSAAGNVGAG
ncbi:MAG: response regulator, partial [Vicinamibacteria bacterium]